MLEMCSAVPRPPVSPSESTSSITSKADISLILMEAQIEAAEDLDALGQLEWLDDMCEGADINEDTDSGDEDDASAHSCLVISPNGVSTCFESPTTPPGALFF